MPAPVVTVAQMREWEKVTWTSGVTEDAVMRTAGVLVARLAEQMSKENDFVLFLAGKGHNGDDAAYGCEFIRGRRAELIRVVDPEDCLRQMPAAAGTQARADRRRLVWHRLEPPAVWGVDESSSNASINRACRFSRWMSPAV
jgi:NAD(P)H-hydrate repair Nnr-like enzyme with NAD(P)H-hydrate epimerase domain